MKRSLTAEDFNPARPCRGKPGCRGYSGISTGLNDFPPPPVCLAPGVIGVMAGPGYLRKETNKQSKIKIKGGDVKKDREIGICKNIITGEVSIYGSKHNGY